MALSGKSGNDNLFLMGGIVYATPLPIPTTPKEQQALINTGLAKPLAKSYDKQFPWV